jgi:hypothetical protein
MKNSEYRTVAHSVLKDRGFDVRMTPGQGYLPGSRVTAVKAGTATKIAVKASRERTISFTRQENGRWRTLHSVDHVVAVVPAETSRDEAEVFAFDKRALVRKFDRAWKQLQHQKRPVGFNIPVFIPIDAVARKNVGHDIGNLKNLAIWSARLNAEELKARTSPSEDSYIDQFRRRFAAENGVDLEQVMISILGKPK